MAAYKYPCAGGCSNRVGHPSSGCDECWGRLPHELRLEWRKAGEHINVVRSKAAIRADIMAWWKANPAPPRDSTPLWRRHRQEGK